MFHWLWAISTQRQAGSVLETEAIWEHLANVRRRSLRESITESPPVSLWSSSLRARDPRGQNTRRCHRVSRTTVMKKLAGLSQF